MAAAASGCTEQRADNGAAKVARLEEEHVHKIVGHLGEPVGAAYSAVHALRDRVHLGLRPLELQRVGELL